MDLAKFVSLLSKEALYFACPNEFDDPFEGYCPGSWLRDHAIESIKNIETLTAHRNDDVNNQSIIDVAIDNLECSIMKLIEENNSKSGVSCWHKSDYESEAMWKLYSLSGQGIAIESTIGQLKESIFSDENLEVKSVGYVSENVQKDEVTKPELLFMKRKSFEHEKELRAVITLKEKGKGAFVKCDLDKLINHIHISPFAEPYFKEVVENICAGKVRCLQKPVIRSSLYNKPDFKLSSLASK